MSGRTCTVDGCDNTVIHAREMCHKHYTQLRRGSELPPLDPARHVRSFGSFEKAFWSNVAIGDPGECWLWTAGTGARGYGCAHVPGEPQQGAHRVALRLVGRPVPKGLVADHICRNKRCVNPSHLRFATARQNAYNIGPQPGGSQFKGVSWHKGAGKWQASIRYLGKSRGLGVFTDEVEAAKAYDVAAREAFGEFAYLNFAEVISQ